MNRGNTTLFPVTACVRMTYLWTKVSNVNMAFFIVTERGGEGPRIHLLTNDDISLL